MLYNADLDLYRKQQQAISRVKEAQLKAEQQLRDSQQLFEPQNAPDLTPERQMPPPPPAGPQQQQQQQQRQQAAPPPNRGGQGNIPRQQGQPPNRTGGAQGQASPQKPRGLQDLLGSFLGQGGQGGAGETLKSTLSSVTKPIEGILDTFDIDSEKLIILLAMWVIFNEKADKTLLMALGYLLL